MTAIPNEEVKARLAAIEQGPWSSKVSKARKQLAPVDRIGSISRRTRFIALDKFDMSSANKRKSNRLVEILRPHFESEDEVGDPGETRSNLDNALTLPQLYELAVQSGYLPESSVREPARAILKDLLWSAPARHFVSAYDYVAVAMLAGRVGVSGLDPARPPEPNPNGALHFAAFLAHLRAFYTDDQIEVWVRFLDDYIVEEDEPNLLWEYLRGKRKLPPSRAEELLAGCQVFVTSLASAFNILSEDELGHFGLVHSYWLQKFFGYERDSEGYFAKNTEVWGRRDSWAATISTSRRLVEAGTDPKIEEVVRRQFVENVELLRQTFESVKRLASEARPSKLVSPASNARS
jgi:hypothetical protein